MHRSWLQRHFLPTRSFSVSWLCTVVRGWWRVDTYTISPTNMAMVVIGENGNGHVERTLWVSQIPRPLSIQHSAPLPLATLAHTCFWLGPSSTIGCTRIYAMVAVVAVLFVAYYTNTILFATSCHVFSWRSFHLHLFSVGSSIHNCSNFQLFMYR